MAQRPVLSVIVPTRNRAQNLSRCLGSIAAADDPGIEIVVIDNGSTDSTSYVFEQLRLGPRFRLVAEPTPGLNNARNAGVAAATAAVICFIDDDQTVPSDYFTRSLKALSTAPEIDGVGGPCIEAIGTRRRTCSACSLGDAHPAVDPDGVTSSRLLGGNMVIRAAAFERVGGFDPSLSGRGDEAEWFHRAAAGGLRFRFDADLIVEHHRDDVSAVGLLRRQFQHGKTEPLAGRAMGRSRKPRPKRFAGGIWHAVRRRCLAGLVQSSREMGATWAWLRLR